MSDICLVSMPYARLETPSSAVGYLVAAAKEAGLNASAVYASFWFAEKIDISLYVSITTEIQSLLGEWSFSKEAFPEFQDDTESYLSIVLNNPDITILGGNYSAAKLLELRRIAGLFIAEAAERILEMKPKIVGCSSMVQQHCASLALFRKIKQLSPEVVTLMGGANCDATMGLQTKLSFPCVDFVVSGEADKLFPKLCRTLLEKGSSVGTHELPAGVIGSSFTPGDIPPIATVDNMDALPIPDYDDYFSQLSMSSFKDTIFPYLPMETSRGCWWGEKGGCSFCSMVVDNQRVIYRSKSGDRVLRELEALTARYGINGFFMTDTIIDMKYFKTLLPSLAAQTPPPYRFFYHVRSTLGEKHLKMLSDAGCLWIMAGIESLHDTLLGFLRKGNSVMGSIAMLKFALENGLRVSWNFITRIPGEQDEYYHEMASWMPMIFHLQPPDACYPLRFDRFSHYHHKPDVYGLELIPNRVYPYIYPLSSAELDNFAFFFEDSHDLSDLPSVRYGLRKVEDTLREWRKLFVIDKPVVSRPELIVVENDDSSFITDTRHCAVERSVVLRGIADSVHRACRKPCSETSLYARLKSETGREPNAESVDEAIDFLQERKLLLSLNGKLLSLATFKARRPLITLNEAIGSHSDNVPKI